jgi:hypothetical protein
MLINTDDMAGVEVVRTRKSKTHRGGTGGESKTIDPWQAGQANTDDTDRKRCGIESNGNGFIPDVQRSRSLGSYA